MPLIRNHNDTPRVPVDMDGASGASMAVMVGREDGAPNFSLRSFEVTAGGHTPKHSHDYEHEVVIVGGEGHVLLEGSPRPIRAGDVIFVPPNEEHQFIADAGQVLRFLCLVPAERQCGGPTPGS